MSRPTRLGAAVISGAGLALGATALALASRSALVGLALAGAGGIGLVIGLYLWQRDAWHRAAGHNGPEVMHKQWVAGAADSRNVGRWSAVGASFGGVGMLLAGLILGIDQNASAAFLAAALGGFLAATGALWLFLLRGISE